MKRRGFLGILVAMVATPLGVLMPKRDMEAGARIPLSEPLPGLKPVLVTKVGFVLEFVAKKQRHLWKVCERYSNGYSRTIWTKRLDMEFWFDRVNRRTCPDDLPYKHLSALWSFDSQHIGPGPRTFH